MGEREAEGAYLGVDDGADAIVGEPLLSLLGVGDALLVRDLVEERDALPVPGRVRNTQ